MDYVVFFLAALHIRRLSRYFVLPDKLADGWKCRFWRCVVCYVGYRGGPAQYQGLEALVRRTLLPSGISAVQLQRTGRFMGFAMFGLTSEDWYQLH